MNEGVDEEIQKRLEEDGLNLDHFLKDAAEFLPKFFVRRILRKAKLNRKRQSSKDPERYKEKAEDVWKYIVNELGKFVMKLDESRTKRLEKKTSQSRLKARELIDAKRKNFTEQNNLFKDAKLIGEDNS